MNKACYTMLLLVMVMGVRPTPTRAQNLPNPILFVTQVPTPNDSATVAAPFANHVADMMGAPRGGDLWIRYPDGSLKNLTQTAGYGVAGAQGNNAIAVREPSVHWNGTKALFSMVVGGATQQGDATQFYWQIYEITGLGKNETPVITRVANQPANFNNVSPIYGTDDRVIFTSDRTINGLRYLYPAFDEYKGAPTNTGLWSLNPATGDLRLLDNSPSGDFSPFVDSYGRVLLMRWDRLQRDRNADIDVLGPGQKGTFNYTDESPNGQPQFGVRTETFPEPQGSRTDLLAGTNMTGFEFNQFFPWQINEDGTGPETINHLGRHEMRQVFNRSITDDSNVVAFNFANTARANRNPINNFMQVKEDPNVAGLYYGVDAPQSGTHAGGQIVSLTAAPNLDPNQTVVTYVTDRTTSFYTFEGNNPNPNHSGFYRSPLVCANAALVASHSVETHADKNLGTRGNPVSRYAFRLKTLKKVGNTWVPDQLLTTGLSKSVSYWDPDTLVNFNGTLWELDPVEVRARPRPQARNASIPGPEHSVFTEEAVDEAAFRAYMVDSNLALAVSRDVTHRDALDHQQPFYLRITGTNKQSANVSGKLYDVSHMQFYQGDYVRGSGLFTPNGTPHAGRRILAVPMHLPAGGNVPSPGGPAGGVALAVDGSLAAFVPARRPMTWQLTGAASAPVVRERYWVTFQPGEVRVCASCHGTNDAAAAPLNPIPQNKPEALRTLLRAWKTSVLPAHVSLQSPADNAGGLTLNQIVTWLADGRSTSYRVQVATTPGFAGPAADRDSIAATQFNASGLENGTTYYWRVFGRNKYGTGAWSDTWSFTTVVAAPPLRLPANGATAQAVDVAVRWGGVKGADVYHVQIATDPNLASAIMDTAGVADTVLNLHGLAGNTRYYWRARAVGQGTPGAWSETWSFTTAAPPRIGTPILKYPTNGLANQPTNQPFQWKGVSGAVSYTLQVATSAGFAQFLFDTTGLTDTIFAGSWFDLGQTYYWHVRANGTADTSAWSEAWTFSTSHRVDTGVPALVSPVNGSWDQSAINKLIWRSVRNATAYEVQLTDDGSFADLLFHQITPDTQVVHTPIPEFGMYYWRVRAIFGVDSGAWCRVWLFNTGFIGSSVDEPRAGNGTAATLTQNRPDPFTGQTDLSFWLPAGSSVDLALFDLRGVRIATLVAGREDAGPHTVTLNANAPPLAGLPGGVYVARLITASGVRAVCLHLVR